jgi:hypothetical protein
MTPQCDLRAILSGIDKRVLDAGVEVLTGAERVLYVIGCLFFEVPLGGFWGYYGNSAGNHAAETVEALLAVGAVEAAWVLREANGRFPGGEPSSDLEARAEQLGLLLLDDTDAEEDLFADLWSRMEDVAADIDTLVGRCAVEHWSEIRPSI